MTHAVIPIKTILLYNSSLPKILMDFEEVNHYKAERISAVKSLNTLIRFDVHLI